jgi:hypothetical protein
MSAPGDYEPGDIEESQTKNFKQGYRPALPRGRGATVGRVIEHKDPVRGFVGLARDPFKL